MEPKVQIGDYVLSEAQATAVRVAVISWHSQLASGEAAELGDIGPIYQQRLGEVLNVWVGNCLV